MPNRILTGRVENVEASWALFAYVVRPKGRGHFTH